MGLAWPRLLGPPLRAASAASSGRQEGRRRAGRPPRPGPKGPGEGGALDGFCVAAPADEGPAASPPGRQAPWLLRVVWGRWGVSHRTSSFLFEMFPFFSLNIISSKNIFSKLTSGIKRLWARRGCSCRGSATLRRPGRSAGGGAGDSRGRRPCPPRAPRRPPGRARRWGGGGGHPARPPAERLPREAGEGTFGNSAFFSERARPRQGVGSR